MVLFLKHEAYRRCLRVLRRDLRDFRVFLDLSPFLFFLFLLVTLHISLNAIGLPRSIDVRAISNCVGVFGEEGEAGERGGDITAYFSLNASVFFVVIAVNAFWNCSGPLISIYKIVKFTTLWGKKIGW